MNIQEIPWQYAALITFGIVAGLRLIVKNPVRIEYKDETKQITLTTKDAKTPKDRL